MVELSIPVIHSPSGWELLGKEAHTLTYKVYRNKFTDKIVTEIFIDQQHDKTLDGNPFHVTIGSSGDYNHVPPKE